MAMALEHGDIGSERLVPRLADMLTATVSSASIFQPMASACNVSVVEPVMMQVSSHGRKLIHLFGDGNFFVFDSLPSTIGGIVGLSGKRPGVCHVLASMSAST